MTSSIKWEVHNVSQHCLRRTEPQVTCTKYLLKFGCTVFELCEWTDRETDAPSDKLQYLSMPVGQSNNVCSIHLCTLCIGSHDIKHPVSIALNCCHSPPLHIANLLNTSPPSTHFAVVNYLRIFNQSIQGMSPK